MSDRIDALLREREGYVRRGLADRVASVDEAIEYARKVEADAPDDEVVEDEAAADHSDDPDAHASEEAAPRRRRKRAARTEQADGQSPVELAVEL